MFDITALGELLVDFTPAGVSQQGYPLYEMNPGGAPANVAVGAAILGARAAFLGKIGADGMGTMLKKVLVENKVDTQGLKVSDKFSTMFTMVEWNETGDRSFRFFRGNSADINIFSEDIDTTLIKCSRVLHFGSISMTDDPSRTTTIYAVKTAFENGVVVSFDPNYRKALWKSEAEAVKTICSVLPYCSILKVSEEELQLLTGTEEIDEGIKFLAKTYDIPLIFATLGSKGCRWRFGDSFGSARAYNVKTIDTTGAGDSFVSAVLYSIFFRRSGLNGLQARDISEISDFACAASSITTSKVGAIAAMPSHKQVEELLATHRHL